MTLLSLIPLHRKPSLHLLFPYNDIPEAVQEYGAVDNAKKYE